MSNSPKQRDIIYCDYCATAPMRPEVNRTMQALEASLVGNPSSIHRPGQIARTALETARRRLAAAIGAQPEEIVFTSGGTEANNAVLFGLLNPGDRLITSRIEHPSVLRPAERLAASGVRVIQAPVGLDGQLSVEKVAAALSGSGDTPRLLSIMAINNETGAQNDLAALGALADEQSILFHTDAVQALGKVDLDVRRDKIHFLSGSAHKLGGPKGMGLLYIREGVELNGFILGGSQENHHRAGTQNLSGAVGFATALELALQEQIELARRLRGYRQEFLATLSDSGTEFHVNGAETYPGIINLRFPRISGQALVMNLDIEGVAASYGSSCASGSAEPSHVLTAMGLSEQEAAQSLRLSFGYATTREEVLSVAQIIAGIVARISRHEPAVALSP